MIVNSVILIIIGLSGGLVVGTGFVAFLAVLGIIPRLTQLTKTNHFIQVYEWAIILGTVITGWMSLRDTVLFQSELWLIPIGLFSGMFIGMLAAALTEVLNVFPILAKRIGLGDKIVILLMAIVFGKIIGSLFHWIYFVNH
ncbi:MULTISPECIES: stage V sporulation protein AB [Metabacillus]|jgi:stage V sporulation protein AB|uniref:Stage V sporulation protein AB n=3 Tax=Metabacillus TaxID=2675233 RepID=A0A179T4M3_9BACI|nr:MULTISPECIES: stage V sporulation protein AB [Metabacillus]OAS87523.1 stage V sporulation protein AB [Metabacillus litoralis]QNF31172.1 stage V sporulation protein AB [Metabacillus sp. KUDC1714]